MSLPVILQNRANSPVSDNHFENNYITFQQHTYPIEWKIRAHSKKITVRLHQQLNKIIVTLASVSYQKQALFLIKKNEPWLLQQLKEREKNSYTPFVDGASLSILGQSITIHHVPSAQKGVWVDNNILYVSGEACFLARRVRDFLKTFAYPLIHKRLQALSHQHALPFRKLYITDTLSRWGSCSSLGSIRLSWRLILAPEYVLLYVIAHELAHTKHLNHGRHFWELVNTLTPHRQNAEIWLKQNGHMLLLAGKG